MWIRVFLVVVGLSLLAPAQPCQDIRTFDFRNATLHTSANDENKLTGLFNTSWGASTFRFKNGLFEEFTDQKQRKAGTPEARVVITPGATMTWPSGPTLRFVTITWEHLQGPGEHAYLLGFACRNNTLQRVFQFSSDGLKDFSVGSENQLVIKQAIWKKGDAHCCPSQTRTVYYGWDSQGQRFKRVSVDGPKPVASEPPGN